MQNGVFGVRLSDLERKLLGAAAQKEQVTESALARRALLKESRAVLTPANAKDEGPTNE